jgi:vacuolar-type H+-ATPase subunit E/Vma4
VQPLILNESGMKLYTDSEVDQLIDDISRAAKEAIEKAAAEAAKAATIAGLEREAEALREAQRWKQEAEKAKQAQAKNYILTGVISFLGGLVVGVAGTMAIRN